MINQNQIFAKEENGKFIIFIPIIDPDAGCKLSCLCFVCLIDILFAVLYFVTWEDIFLYILIAIDVPLGI